MPGDKTYAIHPAIGVARMGNAEANPTDPSSYYLGPESPYQVANDGQPYKVGGRIKKQAQRFRIYEFQDGEAVREITLGEGDIECIEWTVHLSNRKAALDISGNGGVVSTPGVIPASYGPAATRNHEVPADKRSNLCIDPGACSVWKEGSQQDLTGSITFTDKDREPKTKQVTLGRLYVEPGTGRLLVFAGNGMSEGLLDNGSFSPLATIETYANNDNWYDEIADGRVAAEITFRDGSTCTLDQAEQSAWVIAAVPRFAPGLLWLTSLYEVAIDAARPPAAEVPRPTFARDIYPILRSASLLPWISARAARGHGQGTGGYYLSADRLRTLSENNPSPDSDAYKARQWIFNKIRNPANATADADFMPRLPREVIDEPVRTASKPPWDIASVTPLQYALLQKWRDGDFDQDTDEAGRYVPLDQLSVSQQPSALDRAALEGTAGTPFYPGIESWRIMRERGLYSDLAPLRIASSVRPGDLTIGNALPWQADYLDCNDAWWPVQRPNQVTRGDKPLQPWVPEDWEENEETLGFKKMVQNWWHLGFVVTLNGGASYVETERTEGEPLA